MIEKAEPRSVPCVSTMGMRMVRLGEMANSPDGAECPVRRIIAESPLFSLRLTEFTERP